MEEWKPQGKYNIFEGVRVRGTERSMDAYNRYNLTVKGQTGKSNCK